MVRGNRGFLVAMDSGSWKDAHKVGEYSAATFAYDSVYLILKLCMANSLLVIDHLSSKFETSDNVFVAFFYCDYRDRSNK